MSSVRAPLLVVGSVNADIVFSDLESLPRPGETVSAGDLAHQFGGKGANQAAAAAAIGADVALIASVGADPAGDAAIEALERQGVQTAFIRRCDRPTGVAAVAVDVRGENLIIIAPGANATMDGKDAEPVLASIGQPGVVLACLEVPLVAVLAWARAARRAGWLFVLNPAPAPRSPIPAELFDLVDVLVPNEHEFAAICGNNAAELLKAGVGAVVVTRGSRGAELNDASGTTTFAAFPIAVRDTTGAGDAFNAGLATALAEGKDLASAIAVGSACGALATRAVGARGSLPTRQEVDAMLASRLDQ